MVIKYKDKIKKLEKEIKHNDVLSIWIGCIKLGIIILISFAIYQSFVRQITYMYIVIVATIGYLFFALWQVNIKGEIEKAKHAIILFKRHIDRIDGDWIYFKDTGAEYLDQAHLYARDLDVVGNKSIFQLLNLTSTYHGRKQFSNDLLYPEYSFSNIQERQQAIQELSNSIEIVNAIEQKTFLIGTDDRILKILSIITRKTKIYLPTLLQRMMYITPFIATIGFIIGWYFKVLPMIIVGLIFLIIQGSLWIVYLAKIQERLQKIRKIPFHLREYMDVFKYIKQQEFSSSLLNTIKNNLDSDILSSNRALKDLNTIVSMISIGNNFIIYGVLNIFCLWDFHCYIRFRKWQEKYADVAESWFVSLGELESLMSFSILPMAVKNTCIPQIQKETGTLDVVSLGHPLLHKDKRVCNDFTVEQNIAIISGSNMSGKTTFMRTIGINLLLAKTGSFVCAKQMKTSIFNIVTSMRIVDNLNEGVSTFYAELKNIKKILEIAKEDPTTFFMIDEIFRGTNSVDRLEGAQIVLKRLHQLKVSGMITTHDLELCNIEKEYININNYHFSEKYSGGELIFDYQLCNGISTTTNAKQLMQLLGII